MPTATSTSISSAASSPSASATATTRSTPRSTRRWTSCEHVSTVFANEPQVALAKKLASDHSGRRADANRSSPTAAPKPMKPPSWPPAATPVPPKSSRCAIPITAASPDHGRSPARRAWKLGPPQAGIVHARQRLLLPLPLRPRISVLRSEMRAGYGSR